MSIALTVNGVVYNYPSPGDTVNWGQPATQWAAAVTANLVPRTGGSFPITGEIDLGSTSGMKMGYMKTETATPASSGVIRLANADQLSWRNAGNTADIYLTLDASNNLSFNGTAVAIGSYVSSFNGSSGAITLTGTMVDTALGYTPYNATNPSGYLTSGTLTGVMVDTALGYTPYNATNPAGYLVGISGAMVTAALGYTPYNTTNPSGYLTSGTLTGAMVNTALGYTAQANLGYTPTVDGHANAVSSITPGSSTPWTNSNSYPVSILINPNGSTIFTLIQFGRGGVYHTIATNISNNQCLPITLSPGDSFSTTYTGSDPTILVIPR
jgi:hypothetical protein